MKKLYILCAFCASAVSLVAGPTVTYGTSTYQLIDDQFYTWHQAKAEAEKLGGHLATITSQAENDAVFPLARELNSWLGGYRQVDTSGGTEGQWKWVTGETWDYSNWGPHGNDNANGQEHYLHFHNAFPSQWNDHHAHPMTPYHSRPSFILEIPNEEPKKNTKSISSKLLCTYTHHVPTGFSMMSVPFSYRSNKISDIFGKTAGLVIYDYDYFGGWVMNSYDEDFEEWHVPNHVIHAGTAIWVRNDNPTTLTLHFKGDVPRMWRVAVNQGGE